MKSGTTHIHVECAALQTAKIGSLVEVADSEDPEGLRVFYYLVQDLKVRPPQALWRVCPHLLMYVFAQCLIFSLISLHFKIKPI